MNAIIMQGGKQYHVQPGDEVVVEKIDGNVGDKVVVPTVMTYENGKIDTKPGKVTATIVEIGKGDKIDGFKYKPKNNVRKKYGHRQPYTKIKIGGNN